jgi:hypothetical protein
VKNYFLKDYRAPVTALSWAASVACDGLEAAGFISAGCTGINNSQKTFIQAHLGLFVTGMVFIIVMPLIYIYFWVVVNSYRFVF